MVLNPAEQGLQKARVIFATPPDKPFGTRLTFGEHGCIWLGCGGVMWTLALLAVYGLVASSPEMWPVAVIPAVVGLASFAISKSLRMPPSTPQRAITNFYEFISRSSFRSAYEMVAPSERLSGAGPYASFDAFKAYWSQLRKDLKLRSGKVFFSELTVHPLTDSIALCRMKVEVAPNMIPVVVPVPGIATLTGTVSLGSGGEFVLQKLLVHIGSDWLLWSPMIMAPEEYDVAWLQSVASEMPH